MIGGPARRMTRQGPRLSGPSRGRINASGLWLVRDWCPSEPSVCGLPRGNRPRNVGIPQTCGWCVVLRSATCRREIKGRADAPGVSGPPSTQLRHPGNSPTPARYRVTRRRSTNPPRRQRPERSPGAIFAITARRVGNAWPAYKPEQPSPTDRASLTNAQPASTSPGPRAQHQPCPRRLLLAWRQSSMSA